MRMPPLIYFVVVYCLRYTFFHPVLMSFSLRRLLPVLFGSFHNGIDGRLIFFVLRVGVCGADIDILNNTVTVY